jgi:hypothetical protein
MRRLLAALTVGLLSLLGPLIVPTPTGPKLRLPQVQAPPASLMLEKRPLQIRPTQSRPSLNVLPPADPELSPEDGVEEPADGGERRPGLHLRHGR